MITYVAPAGCPVGLATLLRGFVRNASEANESLRASIRDLSGLRDVWAVSSGRAAMTLILVAMREAARDASRTEVIIPAYTCYSVPAAIVLAGLRPRLCDVDPTTLSMSMESLERFDFSRVLAVLSANLYGLPNDLEAIEGLCRRHGVYFLDDAAQALGATHNERAAGSFGTAGLYSFDKGKIISSIQGGVIVCRDVAVVTQLESLIASLPFSSLTDSLVNVSKLFIYSIFLRPSLYGLIHRLPFTGLGMTRYEKQFPITRLAGVQTSVAADLMRQVENLNSDRRRRADELTDNLSDIQAVQPIRPIPGAQPVYARFPVRLSNPANRNAVIAALDRAGIGASASYPRALADVPEIAAVLPSVDLHCPGAREVAASIMTLPTHAYCPTDLPRRIHEVLLQWAD